MHKGIILLVKRGTRHEALEAAVSFLEEYKNDVWDWYQIGGRWTQTLSPMNKEFLEKTKEILETSYQSEVDEKQRQLQTLWESLNGKGDNPYCNHYNLPKDGGYYDILPLKECIDIVKEWQQTIEDAEQKEKEAKERWLEITDKRDEPDYRMYGYALKIAANLYQQNFCFDCNVFNIENYNYSIPENIEDYSAVMIDIHN